MRMTESNTSSSDGSSTKTRFEILVGLHVHDNTEYDLYRAGMTPMLHAMGGFFRQDLHVSEQLKGEEEGKINRAFVISFPDEKTKDAFFSDEAYKAVRAEHFDAAVDSSVILASYHT